MISCQSEDQIRTYRLPKKSKDSPLNVKEDKVVPELLKKNKKFTLKWQIPEGWEQFDGHSMRMASFYVPHSTGKENYLLLNFQE